MAVTMLQIIQQMQAIVLLASLLISRILGYTPYPPEETQRIRTSEANLWNAQANEFHASEVNTFVVERRVYYFVNSSISQTIKMRGRAYFVGDRRKIVPIKDLSPFDVTKIYVYSQNGLIVKSAEFYESFAFTLPIKQSEMYQILFEDGPPGPPKLIQWEIDYEAYHLGGKIVPFSPQSMQVMSGRLKQIEQFVVQSAGSSGLTTLVYTYSKIKLMNDQKIYEGYLIGEAIFVCVVMIYETMLLKKMLKCHDNIIMI